MVPLTHKPTAVTSHSANAIDHIITNNVSGHNGFKSTLVKTDVSDHFPILLALKTNEKTQKPVVKSAYKRSYCKKNIDKFKIICATEIGMALKKLKTTIKHINTFSISLFAFMRSRSQKPKLKSNTRAIKALGLLKVLQNHQKRSKYFLKNF